jgi:hypothetical protein
VWKQEFQEQWKVVGIGSCIAYKLRSVLRTQFGEGFSLEWPIADLAGVAGKPGLADLLVKLVIGIDG